MPRKKETPNHGEYYEYKISVGKRLDGSPIRKSFYSKISKQDAKNAAEEWRINEKAHALAGLPLNNDSIRFDEWANLWLEKYKRGRVKDSTFTETYQRPVKKILIPYFGRASISQIKPIDIQDFLEKQAKIYSESTMKKLQLCLNAIFETAIDNDLCYKNPAKKVSYFIANPTKKRRVYSKEQVKDIIRFASSHPNGLPVWIMLELGLRCSEMLGLRWTDIDFKCKTINICRASTAVAHKAAVAPPKSKSSIRTLPVSSTLLRAFKSQINSNTIYIVESTRVKGKPLTPTDYRKRYLKFFKDYTATLSNPDSFIILTPHELRHTCGTLLYDKTHDIYAVSKYLGHANVDITARLYVHDNPEMLRNSLGID